MKITRRKNSSPCAIKSIPNFYIFLKSNLTNQRHKLAITDVPAITVYRIGTPEYQEVVLRASLSRVFMFS